MTKAEEIAKAHAGSTHVMEFRSCDACVLAKAVLSQAEALREAVYLITNAHHHGDCNCGAYDCPTCAALTSLDSDAYKWLAKYKDLRGNE